MSPSVSNPNAPPSVLDSILAVRYWLLGFFAAGVLIAVFGGKLLAILPGCTLYSVTGLHCPGCGSTRAIQALARGELTQALGYNLLLTLGLPLMLAGLVFPKVLRSVAARASHRSLYVMLGVILVFWIARNVAVYPLNWLAP